MLREAAVIAVAEVGLFLVLTTSQGESMLYVLAPVYWFVATIRLWVGLWIASAFSPNDGSQFVVAAAAVRLIMLIFLSIIIGGNPRNWQ